MYIGVDQSLRSTGVAILTPDGALQKLFLITTGERRGASRLQFIATELAASLRSYRVMGAASEGYAVNAENRPFDLGEVSGVIRVALLEALAGAEPLLVPPTMLKKFVAGNGSATKKDVQKAIATKWDTHISQDDMADAYGLAQLARAAHMKTRRRREELEVIQKLLHPDPVKGLNKRVTPAVKTPNV